MPGERADVIVDFTDWWQHDIVVTNDVRVGEGGAPPGEPLNVVGNAFMQFRVVKPLSSPDNSTDFGTNPVIHAAAPTAQELAARAVKVRTITLDVRFELPNPGLNFAADSHLFALLNMTNFDAPVTELPRAGDVEIWEFANLTGVPHPMHVHLLDFLVLDRRSFRGWIGDPSYVPQGVADYIVDRQLGRLKSLAEYLDQTTNGVRFVQRNELGPKDVVHAAPGAVTRIVMQWPTNDIFHGPYVYHCHILDHEDNDMMRPLEVLPPLPKDSLFTTFDLLEKAMSIQLGTRAGPVNGMGVTYDVQASSDLKSWHSLTNATGTGMTLYLKDPAAYALDPAGDATGAPSRFYRAVAYP
jgi:spore coat protein A